MNDELLVKYLLNEVTQEERSRVESWIKAVPGNRAYFEQFRSIWEESKKIEATSELDEHAAWQRFRSRIHTPATDHSTVKRIPVFKTNWFRVAALVILVTGVSVVTYNVLKKEPGSVNVVAAATGHILMDTLPDGSVITLNKNSTLTYPKKFKGNTRTVALRGEAFFNVTPDKMKPFLIRVNDVTVRVVGTSFNVRSENNITEVIVETGIVQVMKNNGMVELRAGEKVVVDAQDTVLKSEKENEQLYNYYRTKEFVCDNTPLWKLVEVLNEAYQVHITIERKELRNLPLTTTFSNESLEHILEIIGLTLNARVTHSGDRIIIQ